MKRTRSGAVCCSPKRIKSSPELPVEIWHMIFSQVSFVDQQNCRTICKYWRDVIASLPAFRDKNCLVLGYCSLLENQPPLPNSKFPVDSLKFAKCSKMLSNVQLFPTFPTFLIRIGETLTHLDISKNDLDSSIENGLPNHSNIFRVFLENLSLFKVLKELNVGSLTNWLEVVDFRWSDKKFFKDLLLHIYSKKKGYFTYEFAKIFLNDLSTDYSYSDGYSYQQRDEIKKHSQLFLQKIKDNLDLIKKNQVKSAELIALQVCNAIKKPNTPTDLSSKINTSIQIISIKDKRWITAQDVKNLMVLVPNVQQIKIKSNGPDTAMELIESLSDKITQLYITHRYHDSQIDLIKKINLCSLKYIKGLYSSEAVDRCIQLFPLLNGVTGYACLINDISNSHFEYITTLNLKVYSVSNETLHKHGLQKLSHFKNLHKLAISLFGCNATHFFSHSPVNLASLKKFIVRLESPEYCLDCMESMIKSMSNLLELDIVYYTCVPKWNCLDMIFKYQSNLKTLKIGNRVTVFEPNDQWQEMRSLTHLDIKFRAIGGSKASWDRFGQKLKKLKYFRAAAFNCIDLEQMIGSSMLALQRVVVTCCYEYEQPKVIESGKSKYLLVNDSPTDICTVCRSKRDLLNYPTAKL